ncbi:MAG: hypothetical protein ACKVIQ_11120 [Acidimicrobiales bacterium]|jgi:hypothetical protein
MATRIDIEVTSDRGDGTFTWRAAGAKHPKGVFDAPLLPAGCAVGDILRAEAEFTVDGPELISITAPKGAKPDLVERLEVIGTQQQTEAVTTQLAKKGGRGGGRGGGGRGRDSGRGGDSRDERGPRGDNRKGGSEGRGGGREGGGGGGRGQNRRNVLKVKRTHREEWIATLAEGRRPVAEQLMHEGRDGVSGALARQNKAALIAGRDAIDIGPIMKIADALLPALAISEWRDTADAAVAEIDTADVRELRKVVIAGDAFASNASIVETQALLRSKLSARIDKDQVAWSRDLREALTEGRVVRALRSSGRPVKAGVPLPLDLVEQLSAAATDALSPDEEPHRWTMVLEALAGSPIRRLITPEAMPEDAETDDELLDTVERLAHLLPGIAALFDIEVKPRKRNKGRQRTQS